MTLRPLALAATAALVLTSAASAAATSPPAPHRASGTATSSLSLVQLQVGGHDLRLGTVALSTDTLGTSSSEVRVTPVHVDAQSFGEQTVTPSSSPRTTPAFDSSVSAPSLLAPVASVHAPAFAVTSSTTGDALARVGTTSLGGVSVLGLPLALTGSADASSVVGSTEASATKTLDVRGLTLPSLAATLAALGIDLRALPQATLTELVDRLHLSTPDVAAAQAALSAAEASVQAQLDTTRAALATAQSTLASRRAAFNAAQSALADARAGLDAAQTRLTAADAASNAAATTAAQAAQGKALADAQLASATSAITAAFPPGVTSVSAYLASPLANPALVSAYQSASAASAAATATASQTAAAATDATAARTSAQAAVAVAQQVLDAAAAALATASSLLDGALAAVAALTSTLTGLLQGVAPQVGALTDALVKVLAATPLVSVDRFTVSSVARVTSALPGGQHAAVTGGELQGVRVLGTDVLQSVLSRPSVTATELAGPTLAAVNARLAALTGVLSSVLAKVPGLTVPAPHIELLSKVSSTGVTDGFGTAENSLRALQVTLPAITLPTALALPGAISLPALSGASGLSALTGALTPHLDLAGSVLTSAPVVLTLGLLREHASFQPALAATLGTLTPGTTPPAGTPATPSRPGAPHPGAPRPTLAFTGLSSDLTGLGLLLLVSAALLRRRLRTT